MNINPLETTVTCPWWLLFAFDNPVRTWIVNPDATLADFVRPGDSVLDVGCGMGVYSLPLARRVGPAGHVYAADIQPQMLEGMRRRAARAGLLERITCILTTQESVGAPAGLDFAIANWMVHEVKYPQPFLSEIAAALKPGGKFLLIEPFIHVSAQAFERTLDILREAGLRLAARPSVRLSRAALLVKEA